jgi:hypothetical protein
MEHAQRALVAKPACSRSLYLLLKRGGDLGAGVHAASPSIAAVHGQLENDPGTGSARGSLELRRAFLGRGCEAGAMESETPALDPRAPSSRKTT